MSSKISTILKWINDNFQYPTCSKVNKVADLKSGAAVAEMLTQILPLQYQYGLLAQIEVSNMQSDICVKNWRIIRKALFDYLKNTESKILINKLNLISPQSLYYREAQLTNFLVDILMVIWNSPPKQMLCIDKLSYPKTIQSHLILDQSQCNYGKTQIFKPKQNNQSIIKVQNNSNVNLSQLSDIANTSLVAPVESVAHNYWHDDSDDQNKNNQKQEKQQYRSRIPPLPFSRISHIQNWIVSKLGEQSLNWQPHQQLGHIVNTLFCSSRLNNPVIKEAQFRHGALFVYKKSLQFIVENSLADRVSKVNALQIMKIIEEEGVVRQSQFWRLINDLYAYDLSKGKTGASRSTKKQEIEEQNIQQKQNLHPNIDRKQSTKTLSKCRTSKRSLQLITRNYNQSQITAVQQWMINQLGLEYSVNKIHTLKDIFTNPLINGTLVATIIMRLKIDKISINKQPVSKEQLGKNWDLINKACGLRNYESLKPICPMIHTFNISSQTNKVINMILYHLQQFRLEHEQKNPKIKYAEKNKIPCTHCPDKYIIKKDFHAQQLSKQKQQLCSWLNSNFGINTTIQSLSVNQLTSICRDLLRLNIYKQTTYRIQVNNVQKILGELRRIGLGDYYHLTKQEVMATSDYLRWKILSDIKWLIQGKIQFCRA